MRDDLRKFYVLWVDSANLSLGKWITEEDIDFDEQHLCETLGFQVKETDDYLFIAGSTGPDELGSVMKIPRVSIREKRELTFQMYPRLA